MTTSVRTKLHFLFVLAALAAASQLACSAKVDGYRTMGGDETAGSTAVSVGGASSIGGQSNGSGSGGALVTTGGAPASGGGQSTVGGAPPNSGGQPTAGGAITSGGASPNSGGAGTLPSNNGGTLSSGGTGTLPRNTAGDPITGGEQNLGGSAGNGGNATDAGGAATLFGGAMATGGAVAIGGANATSATTTADGGALAQTAVPVKAIVAAGYHNCALTIAGGVRCWGDNELYPGVLGNGTTTNSLSFPDADVLSSVQAIATNWDHTCALTTSGGVRCWGTNATGALGDGTTVDRLTPPATDFLTSVKAIATGYMYTCAVMQSGGARCWGKNDNGQLGDGTTVDRLSPPTTDFLTNVKTIATSYTHTCAVMQGGGVRCWGKNDNGQLGDGTTYPRTTPPEQDVLTGVADVALASSFTCALMQTGSVRCWGVNKRCTARYCESPFYYSSTKELVSDQVAIVAGGDHVYSLSRDGGVLTSFDNLANIGQMDFGATPSGLQHATAVATSDHHSCAVASSGGVYCWGMNTCGSLGQGKPPVYNVPPQSDVLTEVQAVSMSYVHTCAITTAGGLRCWGSNANGQLGDGSTMDRNTPPSTDILTDVQAVATGPSHTCALTKAGGVRCWGEFEMLGNPNLSPDPEYSAARAIVRPPTEDILTDVQSIASGSSDSTCALTNAGGVRCWGDYAGKDYNADLRVISGDLITGVQAISVGFSNTCAIMTTGGLRCWGHNEYGQLGNGNTLETSMQAALQTEILPNVQSVSVGDWFVCAVTLEGRIQCWGYNGYGQLGDTSPYAPMNIDGTNYAYTMTPSPEFFSGVQSLATGSARTCALTTVGGVRCWGADVGQLVDGTLRPEGTNLVPDIDVISGVKAMAAVGAQTCVITNAGGLRCWGDNANGQLGNGKSYPPQTDIPMHVPGTCD